MREVFDDIRLQVKTLVKLKQANAILKEYHDAGYIVSLRQLFYQFVARGLLENTYNEYKALGECLVTGRNCGVVDWDYMEDRVRNLTTPFAAENSFDMMRMSCDWFQMNPWLTQDTQVEVWVEKDAVFGVVHPICEEFRVPHFAGRGYVSVSELYSAGQRFSQFLAQGQTPIVLYLGDHDPSGINMADDLRGRIEKYTREPVEVRRIALTMEQVERYNPPPNRTKEKDSRTAAYVAEFGTRECWELDALNPQDMVQLIREQITQFIEPEAWEVHFERERAEGDKLKQVRNKWERVVKFTTPRKRKPRK